MGALICPDKREGAEAVDTLGDPSGKGQDDDDRIVYPETKQSDTVNTVHGIEFPDPFDWLEDPDSPATRAWVQAQNELSGPYMHNSRVRKLFQERMLELYNYEKLTCPFKRGKKYYQHRNSGLQNQFVLWRSNGDNLNTAKWSVFIDPNKWSADGTQALDELEFTDDGKFLAYTVSKAGSDWMSVHFRDTSKAQERVDEVLTSNIKFTTLTWRGNNGLFYNKYPDQTGKNDGTMSTTGNEFHMLYYHKLGTDPKKDVRVLKFNDPKWLSALSVSYDQKALILNISESCDPVNQIWIAKNPKKDKDVGKGNWLKIVSTFSAQYEFLWKQGSTFYFRTNLKAPRGRIIACDIDLDKGTDSMQWKQIVPEHSRNVIEEAFYTGSKFLVTYMSDCKTTVFIYELSGKLNRQVPIPIGCIMGTACSRETTEFFLKFTSFLAPGIIYKGHTDKPGLEVYKETKIKGVDLSEFTSKQVFLPSKDGTAKVPMFVSYKKTLQQDSNNPCLLYGYGGFNIPLLPGFSVTRLMWMQHFNGIYCLTNIRGGGEYGQAWHKAGIIDKKQNSYDDFQDCARYMIKEGWTNRDLIVTNGGSNGGTLVAACANQAPELYGAVLCQVPVTDMLKFHTWTIGHCWRSDFGDPEVEDEFQYIKQWSPLHNVKNAELDEEEHYPAFLITTADHDDRVVPAHSFKYAAELQRVLGHRTKSPLLCRVEVKAGHGKGKPTAKIIEEAADMYSFVARALGLNWYGRGMTGFEHPWDTDLDEKETTGGEDLED